jgi:serine/threonine-protein phosphatase 2B catalytic subunit
MFKTLPIAAEINGKSKNKYLCMHGGISPAMKSKDDINAANRFVEPQQGLVFDLLWADPFPDAECMNHSYGPNVTREASYFFGLKPVVNLLAE